MVSLLQLDEIEDGAGLCQFGAWQETDDQIQSRDYRVRCLIYRVRQSYGNQ